MKKNRSRPGRTKVLSTRLAEVDDIPGFRCLGREATLFKFCKRWSTGIVPVLSPFWARLDELQIPCVPPEHLQKRPSAIFDFQGEPSSGALLTTFETPVALVAKAFMESIGVGHQLQFPPETNA